MNSRLGLILLFEGDFRKVHATIKNVTSFTTLTDVLKNGDADVTSTYINADPISVGNMIITSAIGSKASMPAGSYRYFISGIYGGKERTWWWDVPVLPKDLSVLEGIELPIEEDYDPLVEEVTIYEGDNFAKQLIVPDLDFSAVEGKMTLFGQDVTATYCTGTPSIPATNKLVTHNIGGAADIPAGDYGYFITGTHSDGTCKSTWYYKIKVLPKQGVLP
jgi:hypothetical protein